MTDRGITVGKSWPRPATPSELIPRWEGEFVSHQDWVSFASKRLSVAFDSNGYDLKAICVDSIGRRCANGRDFQRANDEGTFPVRYFWDCAPPAVSTAEILSALEGAVGALEFSREFHSDCGNEDQAFAQDRLDAVTAVITKLRGAD